MTSEIKVDEIRTSTGSTTLIDTNQEFDQWYLSADDNQVAVNSNIISGWERYSNIRGLNAPMPIGTGLTQTTETGVNPFGNNSLRDGSVFTFPRPGYYRIDGFFRFRTAVYDSLFYVELYVSNDSGNNYRHYTRTSVGNAEADAVKYTCSMKVFINVINSDTTKFLFVRQNVYSTGSNTETIEGGTAAAKSSFSCQRLAPAQ